jgi:hypothetical protein
MNADQQANIDTMGSAIVETLFSAWSYFHILKGFHEDSKAYPVVVQKLNACSTRFGEPFSTDSLPRPAP